MDMVMWFAVVLAVVVLGVCVHALRGVFSLRVEHRDVKQMAEKLARRCAELQEERDQALSESQVHQDNYVRERRRVVEVQGERDRLKTDLADHRHNGKHLAERNEELRKEVDQLKIDLDESARELRSTRTEGNALATQAGQYHQDLQTANGHFQAAQQENEDLRAKLEALSGSDGSGFDSESGDKLDAMLGFHRRGTAQGGMAAAAKIREAVQEMPGRLSKGAVLGLVSQVEQSYGMADDTEDAEEESGVADDVTEA